MPIVDVEIVTRPDEVLAADLASELANRVGEVFSTPEGRTWVRLRSLSCDQYSENGGGPPPGVLPVFVSVLKARLPAPAALQVEVAALTAAVANACGRPVENVHVAYHPEGVGRVAFGGRVATG